MSSDIQKINYIIEELEQVTENRIRGEERLKREMENLEELGYSSIEEAEEALETLEGKIEKRERDLKGQFEDFMEDYGELME